MGRMIANRTLTAASLLLLWLGMVRSQPEDRRGPRPQTREAAERTHLDCGRGLAPGEGQPSGGSYSGRVLVLSAVGKSGGTFCVTFPVAAHSVPRWYVIMNPTQFSAARSWPMTVWKIRPLA